MEKMRMESVNMTEKNVDKIAALFPNCITESLDEEKSTPEKKAYKKVVNFDVLRQMLSGEVLEGDEAYEFTWVGKKSAIIEANTPTKKTLRPCKEESVNWDSTENLYIEGDNLEVLKLLQESYLGKVKMIYIDPPYNTGNDFIYRDDFAQSADKYDEGCGIFDEDDNCLFKNTDANGRFHSDWCSMIYSRLMLARNLLTDDGVIFISIDDHEQENLKKCCDEVFGSSNFLEQIVWKRRANTPNDRYIGKIHEYIFVYSKNIKALKLYLQPRDSQIDSKYKNPNNDPRGPWFADNLSANGKGGRLVKSCVFPIRNPHNNIDYYPPQNKCWLFNEEKVKQYLKEDRIGFRESTGTPYLKRFLSEVRQGSTLPTIILDKGFSTDSAKEIRNLFQLDVFEFTKPTKLIETLLRTGTNGNDIVLDFFSGSATTAHAVMQLNAEDGGNRKFIMVQLPEKCDKKSEAFKAGYKNICEIGKERIRRAGAKIKEENPIGTQDLDTGFRVLKLDDSNMIDVYYAADEFEQQTLADMVSNIKEDRTALDLFFGCLLDWGLPLSMPYHSEKIDGYTVHTYNDGDLIACFDKNIPESVVKTIAKRKPLRAVFRDSGFASSPAKINVFEIFKLYMPESANEITKRVKVI
ncbi:site-specific DNA-methyltransferase [Blautia sp. An81]|uniref:site-specific DNA-methyltransferase n=1 Tax=Blautia sp. An81 TaxID=1965659 RepID=UPI000B383BC7|nr:site-specific DNA-methyltransferase [Blautia sp. An81]OUN26518.1 site-specific DNA-methyltransferase [Blautia sp. An81]